MARWILVFALLIGLPSLARAGDPIRFDQLKLLVQTGTAEGDLLRLIQEAESIEISPRGIVELKKLGATEAVIAALREKRSRGPQFGISAVLKMLQGGMKPDQVVEKIIAEGLRVQLTVQDKLRLAQVGANADVVRALEGNYVYPGFASFVPDHRLFTVQHPKDWVASSFYTGEGFKVVLSPKRVLAANDFHFGFQVQVYNIGASHSARRFGVYESWMKRYAGFVQQNKKFEMQPVFGLLGLPQKTTLSGKEAVRQQFFVKMNNKACRELLLETMDEEMLFFIEAVAPRDEFEKYLATFEKMLRTFRTTPRGSPLPRLATPIPTTQLVDRCRESVVQVRAIKTGKGVGSGTGFFCREDGYVLTNHHVICMKSDHRDCTSLSRMDLADRFELVWDQTVGPKAPGQKHRRVQAELVATVHLTRPRVDLALLKAAPQSTPYRALSLSRVGVSKPTGLVREGDPVLALGFPLPGRIGIGRMTATTGDLATLSYYASGLGDDQQLDYLRMRLVINKGNSGGPLLNRATGAVVGLNTWTEIAVKGESGVVGEKLGYSSATAIDYVHRYFPQILYYPLHKEIEPAAHVDLAKMLINRDQIRAADNEILLARRKIKRLSRPQQADLYYQLYRLWSKVNDTTEAMKALAKSLELRPKHFQTLVEMAYSLPAAQADRSVGFIERAIRAEPDNWVGYYHRANFLGRVKRHAEALQVLAETEKKFAVGNEASFHKLRGSLCFALRQWEEGKNAYGEALRLDGTDREARLGMASYYVSKKETAGAALEYGRIVADFPNDAVVRERYGRFLRSVKGREAEGVKELRRSVLMTLQTGGRPNPGLLRDLSQWMRSDPKMLSESRALAMLLYRKWPGWRASAHFQLSSCWGLAKQPGLAAAHLAAWSKGTASRPLLLQDVRAMAQARYPDDLAGDVLDRSALGFTVDKAAIASLQKAGLQRSLLMKCFYRSIHDQTQGSGALAPLVEWKFTTKTIDKTVAANARSGMELKNTAPFPLSGIRVRRIYKDKDKKVLYTNDADFGLPDGYLAPGAKARIWSNYHSWSFLKTKVGDVNKIQWYEIKFISARSALFINRIGLTSRGASSAVIGIVKNTNAFPVKNVWVRGTYLYNKGKTPFYVATGKNKGQKAESRKLIARIEPNKTHEVTFKADRATLQGLGVAANVITGKRVFVTMKLLDAELVVAKR